MKKMYLFFVLGFISILSACGGGGSSGSASNASPSNVNPVGFWQGTASSGYSVDMLVLPNFKTYAIFGTPTSTNGLLVYGFDSAQGSISGSSYSGSGYEFEYTGQVFSGSFSSTVTQGVSLQGSTLANGNTSTFSLVPASGFNFNIPANVASVSGNWTGTLLTGGSATVSISSTGALTGSSNGCSYVGTVSPDSSGTNFFNVSLTYGNTPCTQPNQVVTGIGVAYPASTGHTQIIVALQNSTGNLGTAFFAIR